MRRTFCSYHLENQKQPCKPDTAKVCFSRTIEGLLAAKTLMISGIPTLRKSNKNFNLTATNLCCSYLLVPLHRLKTDKNYA